MQSSQNSCRQLEGCTARTTVGLLDSGSKQIGQDLSRTGLVSISADILIVNKLGDKLDE